MSSSLLYAINFLNMFHFCTAGFLYESKEEGMKGGKAKFPGS